MTEYSLRSAKITSPPSQTGWTQVHEFHPEKEELIKERGHFYAVISCGNPIDASRHKSLGIDNIFVGREVLTRLHEEYYGESILSAFNAIGEAVTKVSREFSSIYESIEIAAVSYVGGAAYSSAVGGGEIILFRQNMLARLLMSKGGISEKEKAVTASGYPRESDILIASTSSFFQRFSEGVIRATLQQDDLGKAVERFAGHFDENLSAVFIQFGAGESYRDSGVVKIEMEEQDGEKVLETKDEATRSYNWGIFSSLLRREPNPAEAENSSHSSTGSRPWFSAKEDKSKRAQIIKKIFSIIPERPVRLKRRMVEDVGTRGKRKTTASVGAILLLILLVSIIFGIRQKTHVDRQREFDEKLSMAELKLDEALALYPLNQERARELFLESRQLVDELGTVDDSERLKNLNQKLTTNLESVLGEYKSSTETFLDLTLLSDGFSGTTLGFDEESLYILDAGSAKVVSVNLNSKRSEVVAGPNFAEGAKDITAYSDRVFLLIPPKIFEVGKDSRNEIDDTAAVNSFIKAYAGNIYLLDKTESKIYRYSGSEGIFSGKSGWLAPGVEPNFRDIASWAIDGTMWLLAGGDVLRFSLGNPINFEIIGVFPPFQNPTKLFTNENTDYVYLLEPGQKRVVVINKEGEYKAQYKSDDIGNAKDFSVYESGKKLIILTGEKLLSLELKHLD